MRILDVILEKLHNRKNRKSINNETISEYYSFVSYIYSTSRTILFMLLTLFVAIAIIVNANADMHENVAYLFRDFNHIITSDGEDSDIMDYISNEKMSFQEYKNGLCVLGNENITIFTSTGRKTLHETVNYSEPRLATGQKYVLAYDLGGMGYSLYNSTARLVEKNIETPISGADMSDSGAYAISTKNDEYIGVVNFYSGKSNLLATYEKNSYITDISIDKNGKKIAVVSFTQVSGDFQSELSIYNVGKETFINVIEEKVLPLQCFLNNDEYVCVIYNNMFCAYDRKGRLVDRYTYADNQLVYSNSDNNGTLLVFENKDNTNSLIVFDTKGKMLYNEKINVEIKNIAYNNNYIYIATQQNIEIHSISNKNVKTLSIDFIFNKIVVKSNDVLILCNWTRAENYYLK